MKQIRCSFQGHFYIEVDDNTTFDEIGKIVENYVDELDECIDSYAVIDEYDWLDYGILMKGV